MHPRKFSHFWLLAMVILSSCAPGLSRKVQAFSDTSPRAVAILETRCVSCHNASNPLGGVNLTNVESLESDGLVIAGDPDNSALLRSVESAAMPPSSRLAASDVEILRQWIREMKPLQVQDPKRCPPHPVHQREVPTWESDIKRWVDTKCATCHRTQAPLITNYEKMLGGTATQSLESIKSGKMPPKESGKTVSAAELQLLQDWIWGGMPRNSTSCVPTNALLPPAPTCRLEARPTAIAAGATTQLAATLSGNYSSARWEDIAAEIAQDTVLRTVQPAASRRYTLTVKGPGGETTCSVNVTVGGTPPVAPTLPANGGPKLAMLINEHRCIFCHVQLTGDLTSTRTAFMQYGAAQNFMETAGSTIRGNIVTAAPSFKLTEPAGAKREIALIGSVQTSAPPGGLLPLDVSGDGVADFPTLDYAAIEREVTGTLRSTEMYDVNVSRVFNGNLVVIGTEANPIRINGEVLVKGDLVIKGVYQGMGTIYASGFVYVQGNLRPKVSSFPFPEVRTEALTLADQRINEARDALALAAKDVMVLGDVGTPFGYAPWQPLGEKIPQVFYDAQESYKAWFPGGAAAFYRLYEAPFGNSICTSRPYSPKGGFQLIEAALYAGRGIVGNACGDSYAIRGVMVTEWYSVQSPARDLPAEVSTVHGKPRNKSYIEYDYRFATGRLPLLRHLAPRYAR